MIFHSWIIYLLESPISSNKTGCPVRYLSWVFQPNLTYNRYINSSNYYLANIYLEICPFFCLQSRFSDKMGIKQPITEIHIETPVLQFLKCCFIFCRTSQQTSSMWQKDTIAVQTPMNTNVYEYYCRVLQLSVNFLVNPSHKCSEIMKQEVM